MAETQTGKWSLRRLSRLTGLESRELSLPALFLLGAAVAVVHRYFDFNLGLPGHHGLELLTAVMFARLTSERPWVAVIVVTGTACGDVGLSPHIMHAFKNVPLYYLIGGVIDGGYYLLGRRSRFLPVAAALGAGAFVLKPLVLYILAAAVGINFGFMRHADWFPIVTYICFGAIGSICGALLARAWRGGEQKPGTDTSA
ncbi:MAG: hypothetical protein P8126_01635 [Gammaproteobacteria bacterium]|jgi:hypothetical protein